MCMSVCFTAWAKVELTMHESVEVYLGDSAQIPCQYSFTDANNEPSFVMIQWFVVSTAGPAVKTDTACLELSNRTWTEQGCPLKDSHLNHSQGALSLVYSRGISLFHFLL